jgi:hypothetical protein
MRPRVRSYGDTPTVTWSPGTTLIRNRRILPLSCASTSWPSSHFTRYSPPLCTAVTIPCTSMRSVFAKYAPLREIVSADPKRPQSATCLEGSQWPCLPNAAPTKQNQASAPFLELTIQPWTRDRGPSQPVHPQSALCQRLRSGRSPQEEPLDPLSFERLPDVDVSIHIDREAMRRREPTRAVPTKTEGINDRQVIP